MRGENEEIRREPGSPIAANNRWFVLGLAFLILNAWAILRDKPPGVVIENQSPPPVTWDTRIEKVEGSDQDVALAGRSEILWNFREDMVAEDATHTWLEAGPVLFNPPQAGMFCWKTPRILAFRPEGDWPVGKLLQTRSIRPLNALSGKSYEIRDRVYETQKLEISEATFGDSVEELIVRFNADIHPQDVRKHIRVTSPDSSAPLDLEMDSIAPEQTLKLRIPGNKSNTVYLQFSQHLRPVGGDVGLGLDISRTVKATKDLRLTRIQPKMNSYGKGEVVLKFSHRVLPADLRGLVSVEPEIAFDILPSESWWRGHCRLQADFLPGTTYEVTVQAGLKVDGAWPVSADIVRNVLIPDRPKAVGFLQKGTHLSPSGNLVLAANSLNVDSVRLSIHRIYPNNLVVFGMRNLDKYSGFYGYAHNGLSVPVVKDVLLPVAAQPNQPAALAVGLKHHLQPPYTGVYHVDIQSGDGSRSDRKILHISDIGTTLLHSDKELLVWANSLTNLEPIASATVTLYSETNQTLATGLTDLQGLAKIPVLPNLSETPFLLSLSKGDDTASLFLDETRIDTPTPDGRPYLAGRTEAFLFTDRGIYRPGESLHLKALIRNKDALPIEPFPVELSVIRPDGRVGGRHSAMPSAEGSVAFDIPFRKTDPLGKYTFKLSIPGTGNKAASLGSCHANLEEFTAAKLEVGVSPEGDGLAATPGQPVTFRGTARHLTGRPASGQPATAFASFHPVAFQHPSWQGFTFEDGERGFPPELLQRKKVASGKLDEEGNFGFSLEIPRIEAPSNFEAVVGVTVTDVAGRPVTNAHVMPVSAYPLFAGIRQLDAPGKWEAAAVSFNGVPAKDGTPLQFEVLHVTRSLFLRKDDDGEYRYQTERHLKKAHAITGNTLSGLATFQIPDDLAPGRYLFRVTDPSGGSSASLPFELQDGDSVAMSWAGKEPEKVELSFDKDAYIPGETAVLRIASPFPGKALVTLQQDTLLETRAVQLGPDGTGQILLEVGAGNFPNAWALANVVRKSSPDAPSWQPQRAFGRAALKLSPLPRKLDVRLETPDIASPSATFSSRILVRDPDGNPVDCELALALVDEGVLSLTRFPTPDPLAYFHSVRKPGFQLHDPYGLLLPEMDTTGIQGQLEVGAGALQTPSNFLNPYEARRFRNLALWKPVVRTGPEGEVEIPWELPEFSGKARLMAIAAKGGSFGSAEAQVSIKRPFTVASGLPRFLAPGDVVRMPLRIFNDSKDSLHIEWKAEVSGGLSVGEEKRKEISRETTIPAMQSYASALDLHAGGQPGKEWVVIQATASGETYLERIELSVRPAYAREFKVETGVLAAGEEVTLLSSQGFLPSTTEGKLELSPAPDSLLGPVMESLVHYPYGCLEQTTSGSFPLLYATDLLGKGREAEVREYVQAGIERIVGMQHQQGSFGWWPGDSQAFDWGTLYATQFLLEAKSAGYPVPKAALGRALDWITGVFQMTGKDLEYRDSLLVYALQVMSQAGKPQEGWLKKYWEIRGRLQVEDQVRLALAFAHSGERRKALELANDIHFPVFKVGKIEDWRTLRSPLRTMALLLGLHVEMDPNSAQTARLVQKLTGKFGQQLRWSTQENAMVALSLGKYARFLSGTEKETFAQVVIDGETLSNKDPRQSHAFHEGKIPVAIQLKNEGSGPLYYSMSTDGIPLAATEPRSQGLSINRIFDTGEHPLLRGDVFEVELAIDTKGNSIDHLAIQDLLPAGLEIESSAPSENIRHKEHRDDRFLVFPKSVQGIQRYKYLVRAVTAGNFTLPAPSAVCMYDTEIQAIGEAGTLAVQE
jgi:uncharacterized protein YfaS (alpha-2-macroglobulin family)